jgi:hypothetical protein
VCQRLIQLVLDFSLCLFSHYCDFLEMREYYIWFWLYVIPLQMFLGWVIFTVENGYLQLRTVIVGQTSVDPEPRVKALRASCTRVHGPESRVQKGPQGILSRATATGPP